MPKVPREVVLESYQLKATFFSQKLESDGFLRLIHDRDLALTELRGQNTRSWDSKGASQGAIEIVRNAGVRMEKVFANEDTLRRHSKLLRYYRCVALLPQKGFQALTGVSQCKEIEEGERDISENKLAGVVECLNQLISAAVESSRAFNEDMLNAWLFSTVGTGLEGSWRNQIGTEGERVIRKIILEGLLDRAEVVACTNRAGTRLALNKWKEHYGVASNVEDMKCVHLNNRSRIEFSSEPDVQLFNPHGIVVGAIEIKAGLDPAGALERLGAMLKSFENVLSINPDVTTILVVSCLTQEVDNRIRESSSVDMTFLTTELLNDSNKSKKLVTLCRRLLGLV